MSDPSKEIRQYKEAFLARKPWAGSPPAVMGKVLRSDPNNPGASFARLTDKRTRRFAMLFDGVGMAMLTHRNRRDMMISVACYEVGFLDQKIAEGCAFQLLVTGPQPDALPGTWENLFRMARTHYPEVWHKIEPHIKELRSRSFAEIQASSGFSFLNKSFTLDEYVALPAEKATLAMARLALYKIMGAAALYDGSGWTCNADRERIAPELFIPDKPIDTDALGPFELIPIILD
jgi:hypothetical protein